MTTECPICDQDVEIKAWDGEATCPHCHTTLELDWDYDSEFNYFLAYVRPTKPV